MKIKNGILTFFGLSSLFIALPIGIFFGFNNDERSSRVDPKPVEEKELLLSRNPFNFYNQEAFIGEKLFNNDNGYIKINGKKERILPYGVQDNIDCNDQNEIYLYKIIKNNGVTKKPEINEKDFIKITIKQNPSSDVNVIKRYTSEILVTVDISNSTITNPPKLWIDEIRIEDCSSWAKDSNYEEIRFNKISSNKINGRIKNNEILYKFNTNRTGWFGIRIDDYSNMNYIHYDSYKSPVEDLYFQVINPFLTPTIKYDINKSKGNNLDERIWLYNKYVMPGRKSSLITDGESTAYGKLTETIDFREPYIHNNYHVSKTKQDYDDLPLENEYWNMMNYIVSPDENWKIEINLSTIFHAYIINNIEEFDLWLDENYTSGSISYYKLLKNPESINFLEKRIFNEIVDGTYIFENINGNISKSFTPYEQNGVIWKQVSDGNGGLSKSKLKFDGNVNPTLTNDGYLSIMVEDFVDLNENQVLASIGDGLDGSITSTLTIFNDINGDGNYDNNEIYSLSIEEGSPSTSSKIWKWGGKRFSNPAPSKFITEWNNNGPEYWNFYVITPIEITGIILTATLTTMIFYEVFSIANNEKKREKISSLFKKK